MASYQKKPQKRILLSEEECLSLISLMENGFSLQDAMELLDVHQSNAAFQEIRMHLNHGEKLSRFFASYLPKKYYAFFSGFIRWLPFLESLKLTSNILSAEQEQRKAILKGMVYPCFLLFGVLGGILVFNQTVLPQMLSMISSFGMAADNYQILANGIAIGTNILMLVVLFSVLIVTIALSPKYIVRTYQFLSKVLPDSILAGSASSDFARFFLECVRMKISTRESLEILKTIPGKPLVCFLAEELDRSLVNGEGMEKAMESPYVEQALSRFFRIAMYASNCEKMLEGYLSMVQNRTQLRIKRFTKVVQILAYGTIGAVLVFVYQILMMPMTMIQMI